MKNSRINDSVQYFIDELRARVVAESGIPSDRFHLGKLILRRLKDDPDFIAQIDGATGEKETNNSLLKRSIQCANYFKSLGLKRGDVIILMGPNHLDLAVPFYAASYLGIAIAPLSPAESIKNLENHFQQLSPKLIMCQSENASNISTALENLGMKVTVVTFNRGTSYPVLSEVLRNHENDINLDQFKAEEFDPDETIMTLNATSGTTGLPKYVRGSQKNYTATGHYYWCNFKEFPLSNPMHLLVTPLHWATGVYIYATSVFMKVTRLQMSQEFSPEHVYHLINTYRPATTFIGTPLMMKLAYSEGHEKCDFTSLEMINTGGSIVSVELLKKLQELAPNALVSNSYGMSELNGYISIPSNNSPPNSCGRLVSHLDTRLIDLDTNEDILEPYKPGQLLVKGPAVFKGYHNNPEETKAAFTEDGWMKTGDVLYRDEAWNMYYVERIKLFLKYFDIFEIKVSPVQIETVILKHPGVLNVVVTGIPDPYCGDLVTACVVRASGSTVTAQEIKDLVKDNLPDPNQLRGGVVFVEELPTMVSTKIDRRKVREMVQQLPRE